MSTAIHRSARARRPLARSVAALASVVVGVGALIATAGSASAAAAFPVTVQAGTGAVTITARPTRIISLSPTATEMLFAIGAGHQVVAVDDDSDYPKSAPKTSLSGLSPNIEAIAKYRPDLVVISYNPTGFAQKLTALHIPVILDDAPAAPSGAYSQITQLGKVTGHAATANALVASMKQKIAAIDAAAPHFSQPVTYYFELDQTYYSETSATFVGKLLAPLGLKNIADAAPGAAGGYPQLSSEYIVKANPELILLADTICCHQTFTTVDHRPGWSTITAVKEHEVVGLNDDIASRWGPRIVNLLQSVETSLWTLKRKSTT
jgi:iron complex transport system substrate-binding protein